ncbi:SpoIIE family protein phosphatase [Blastococcus sp. PRF04-17]|uniref:SpoIIE family protein phosphatase n=1 Tax=Blastococcus sp. PRF04-17 TaxID=2933797 RepID=UPI001FF24232|nr:SpoIIE family protein phosphatase [Blastococcus sp. PRF04-17]UOY03800.1 SpoIIE family protein phosphatase [Blastococcus sp. PRF04-17]
MPDRPADAVVVADTQGRITYVDPAISALLGYEPSDVLGRPLTDLLPARVRADDGATTQTPARHADGHEVSVDVTLAPVEQTAGAGPQDPAVVGVLRDAHTAALLERQLQVSRYLAAIQRVTEALTAAPDADVAFEQLLPTLCEELDWDAAILWQPDDGGGRLAHAGTWTAPGEAVPALQGDTRVRSFGRGEGVPGLVWQRRRPVVVEDLWTDPVFIRTAAVRADGVRTAVAFPFLRGDTLLGVCELFSFDHRAVPSELQDVLASAGRQIGQFLARLRAESDVRRLADTLQRSLLPSHLPTIPGVELAARYRAGAEGVLVGGDTYDVMPLADGRWMLFIADVCGAGAEAAAMTALTRHTARAAASGGGDPGAVLAAVNEALLREQRPGPLRFVTACCLILRRRAGRTTAQVATAGHPAPLVRTGDATVTAIEAIGLPLGVLSDAAYEVVDVELPRGATVLLYTDGVTEARDDDGVQFGEERLADVLRRTAGSSADETAEAVVAEVEAQLRGSRHAADDRALVVVRC